LLPTGKNYCDCGSDQIEKCDQKITHLSLV
jgi:hypothetical protein